MPPEPANHGILQRTLQQEQREEIASDGDDIAERIKRNKQILQLDLQRLREKEEADDIFGIAALFICPYPGLFFIPDSKPILYFSI